MDSRFIDEIAQRLLKLTHSSDIEDEWIVEQRDAIPEYLNQAVLFLKPEVTAVNLGVDVKRVIQIVLDSLAHYDVQVGAVRILNSEYLRQYGIMDQHYGVINRISREGRAALSDDARSALEREYQEDLASGATVLGGHQFLNQFPTFSPFALNVLSDNQGTKKLAGGTYCIRVSISGSVYLILNPFHSFQLEHFTAPGKAIVVMEALTNTSWQALRRSLIGATDPYKAEEGSIRRTFLEEKQMLGIAEVSQGANGIHLSAGPLEGMVEFQRFFSDYSYSKWINVSSTVFGHVLIERSVPVHVIEAFGSNPSIQQHGRLVSLFDLTEEADAVIAAEVLSKLSNIFTNS
jgi:Nucleoside diphosphate kinase